jgi:hypothetical protein
MKVASEKSGGGISAIRNLYSQVGADFVSPNLEIVERERVLEGLLSHGKWI